MESLAEGSLPLPTCMPRRKSMKKSEKWPFKKERKKNYTTCFAKGNMAEPRGRSCGKR